MKMIWVIVIAFLIVIVGYILYLGIAMSSTYPAIKKYSFNVNKISFEEKLAVRIESSNGWSFQRNDSIKWEDETCYWASLFYKADRQDLVYEIKYCFDSKALTENSECARAELVSIIDYVKKSDSHKLSDKDVEKLLQILDRTILNELAPACSNHVSRDLRGSTGTSSVLIPLSGVDSDSADDQLLGYYEGWTRGMSDSKNFYPNLLSLKDSKTGN